MYVDKQNTTFVFEYKCFNEKNGAILCVTEIRNYNTHNGVRECARTSSYRRILKFLISVWMLKRFQLV